MSAQVGRRELLIGACAALLASESTIAKCADSHEWTAIEKASVELFREYQDAFDQPTLDINKVMEKFLAPNDRHRPEADARNRYLGTRLSCS